MDNIFHLVNILCFSDPNQLNYNPFHRVVKTEKKPIVLKGVIPCPPFMKLKRIKTKHLVFL